MLTTAVNALLFASWMLLPTAAGAGPIEDPKDDDRKVEKVIVTSDGDDIEVVGDDPVVLRLGRRGFIGVGLVEITPDLRAHFGAPRDAGVLVSGVEPDTPAARAGVQVGDVITAVDGERVGWTGDVSRAIRAKKGGEKVELEVVRDRASRKLTVTVEERKAREHEIDLGDLHDIRRHAWVLRDLDKAQPILENLHDFSRMREQLEDLENRIKELEKKLAR